MAGDLELNGHCLCGAVTLDVTNPARSIHVCHCDMCQRWCGGSFFGLHGITSDNLNVSGDEHVLRYASSDWAERASCRQCGSNLWYHFKPGGTFSPLAGLFDLPEDFAVSEQIFVDERPAHLKLAATSPEKTGAEIIEEAKKAGFSFE